jgi:hypothetical protein
MLTPIDAAKTLATFIEREQPSPRRLMAYAQAHRIGFDACVTICASFQRAQLIQRPDSPDEPILWIGPSSRDVYNRLLAERN